MRLAMFACVVGLVLIAGIAYGGAHHDALISLLIQIAC